MDSIPKYQLIVSIVMAVTVTCPTIWLNMHSRRAGIACASTRGLGEWSKESDFIETDKPEN